MYKTSVTRSAASLAIHRTPPTKEAASFLLWGIGSSPVVTITGVSKRVGERHEPAEIAVEATKGRLRVSHGTEVLSIPDDALTDILFFRDAAGDTHIWRWNPYGSPPASGRYRLLLERAMSSHMKTAWERNVISEDLGRSYPPVSLTIPSQALREWFRAVCAARKAYLTRQLEEIGSVGDSVHGVMAA